MRFVTAAFFGIVGILTGLLLGYALWGQHTADLARELATTNEALLTTKGWLLDEIEWSDERHGQVSASLTKARAESAQARGELARITERHEQVSAALTNARVELLHVRGELTRIAETRPRPDGVARRLGNDNNWSASPNVNLPRR
jgi:hypothetical protein